MKIVTLLENTACREDLCAAHGLSLYIETKKHKILFDMGPNAAFLENAEKLGVDIASVDIAFLSHGHNDHSGGLELFCKRNQSAAIYMQESTDGDYYVCTPQKCAYIGLDHTLNKYRDRFVTAKPHTVIDEELQLFGAVQGRRFWSHANDTLREKIGENYPKDAFRHEQNLLICENGKSVLFGGCAHCGIVNILDRAEEILAHEVDAVFAGFHLYNPSLDESEPRKCVEEIANTLSLRKNTRFYTGHCTGEASFATLKSVLGDRLERMSGGSIFTI